MSSPSLGLSTFSAELASLVERASPFVVAVDGRPRRRASGLVCGPDLVVTADHVLERDEDLSVRVGTAVHAATLAGRDPASDLAVLRVPGLGLAEPPRGDDIRVGSLVVSVSRTGSGTISAGLGVVTAVGGPLRTGRGVVLPQVIRTEAAARPGTSGGAIVDTGGRVIGMTTSGLVRGLPVAIPAAQVWQIASELASNASVRRGYLGVGVQSVRLPARQGGGHGLLVLGLAQGGAADAAGLLVGDVIVGFDGRTIADADDLHDALATTAPGTSISVEVQRADARQRVAVTVGERPHE